MASMEQLGRQDGRLRVESQMSIDGVRGQLIANLKLKIETFLQDPSYKDTIFSQSASQQGAIESALTFFGIYTGVVPRREIEHPRESYYSFEIPDLNKEKIVRLLEESGRSFDAVVASATQASNGKYFYIDLGDELRVRVDIDERQNIQAFMSIKSHSMSGRKDISLSELIGEVMSEMEGGGQ